MIMFLIIKQKKAYEMRISDWSSDVCSSDLEHGHHEAGVEHPHHRRDQRRVDALQQDAEGQPDHSSLCAPPARIEQAQEQPENLGEKQDAEREGQQPDRLVLDRTRPDRLGGFALELDGLGDAASSWEG